MFKKIVDLANDIDLASIVYHNSSPSGIARLDRLCLQFEDSACNSAAVAFLILFSCLIQLSIKETHVTLHCLSIDFVDHRTLRFFPLLKLWVPFYPFQCCAIRPVFNQDLYLCRLDESGSAQEITPNVKEEDLGVEIEETQKQEQERSENGSDNASNR
jgi:hypothetical protein